MKIFKFPPSEKTSGFTPTFLPKIEAVMMFRNAVKCTYVDALRYYDANFVDAHGITTRELTDWIRAYYNEHFRFE